MMDEAQKHDWIKSTLGHGETMCRNCLITNREAAVLRLLDKCEAIKPAQPTKVEGE